MGDRILMGIKVEYDHKKKAYIKGEAQWIDKESILNTRVERIKGDDKIIITTTEGLFFYNTLVDNFTALMSEIDGFEKSDRGVVVNLTHDLSLDTDKRMILFEDFPDTSATVGISRMNDIKRLIKKWVFKK